MPAQPSPQLLGTYDPHAAAARIQELRRQGFPLTQIAAQLTAEGIRARVISIPSWELFEQQDQGYRDRVIPPDVTARISVERHRRDHRAMDGSGRLAGERALRRARFIGRVSEPAAVR